MPLPFPIHATWPTHLILIFTVYIKQTVHVSCPHFET
jgi:hypothetical protein